MKEGQKVRVKIWELKKVVEPCDCRKVRVGFLGSMSRVPSHPMLSYRQQLKEIVDGKFIAFGVNDGDTVAIVQIYKLLRKVELSDILL